MADIDVHEKDKAEDTEGYHNGGHKRTPATMPEIDSKVKAVVGGSKEIKLQHKSSWHCCKRAAEES